MSKSQTLPPSNPYYARGDHLRAKHQLNRTDSGRAFPKWALNHVPIGGGMRILDAGAGWGRFTWPLIEEYGVQPQHVANMDQSVGMLQTAAKEADRRGQHLRLCSGGIETLPFASATFDGVLANHVLYHLNDIPAGARELARMLKPEGWLLATTNSDRIRVTLIDLHHQALTQLGVPFEPEGPSTFSMENGATLLQTAFQQVETIYFEDEVTYSDGTTFVDLYATTGRYRNIFEDQAVDQDIRARLLPTFAGLVATQIKQEGKLRVPILMGAFVCTHPLRFE